MGITTIPRIPCAAGVTIIVKGFQVLVKLNPDPDPTPTTRGLM